MQVASMKTGAATGDGLNNLAGRILIKTAADAQAAGAVSRAPGLYDPSARISLSVDAMLFLSKSKKTTEKQPALTTEEWNNKLTDQLAEREFDAFGKYGESGDQKAYYRAYIEYYDGLSSEDQNSPRYSGTREAAMAGLRSLEYSENNDTGEQPHFVSLVGLALAGKRVGTTGQDKTAAPETNASAVADRSENEAGDGLSNIQKLYSEIF